MSNHTVESLIRVLRQCELHDLNLIELVQTVKTANILTIRACLTTEARGISCELYRELLLVEDYIAIDIGYRHLGSWNEVEVVGCSVVHLTLLIRKLTCTEA